MKLKDIILVGILILSLAAIFAFVKTREMKIVYIQTGALYDGFEMKKELEQAYIRVQAGRKQQLDSLEAELRVLTGSLEAGGRKSDLIELVQVKRGNYLQKKQQFEEDNALMQEQYTSQIRRRLNQYVADYGKEHNCDYILGAEGSGALMYARENADVTGEVLAFINKKYKGIK